MTAIFRHPLANELRSRPTCHGYKSIGGPFCPVTPEERDQLVKFLERETMDMVCTGCGSTKQQRWLDVMGMMSCCDARNMVPAAELIRDLAALKAGPANKRQPDARQKWIADEIAAGLGVNRNGIMRRFGVSRSTADTDLVKFIAAHPGVLLTDPAVKPARKVAA